MGSTLCPCLKDEEPPFDYSAVNREMNQRDASAKSQAEKEKKTAEVKAENERLGYDPNHDQVLSLLKIWQYEEPDRRRVAFRLAQILSTKYDIEARTKCGVNLGSIGSRYAHDAAWQEMKALRLDNLDSPEHGLKKYGHESKTEEHAVAQLCKAHKIDPKMEYKEARASRLIRGCKRFDGKSSNFSENFRGFAG